MQQTTFAAGKLWSSLNTVVKTANGQPHRCGFLHLSPGFNGST
jgi:hypothetical protein